MTQDQNASTREYYENFIDEVLETEIIWTLNSPEGFASCESNDFDDRQVLLFWSNEKQAKALCVDEWLDYKPEPIEFDDFIDAWLHGMNDDELLAGVNWNDELIGPEIEPIILIEDLIGEE